MSENQDQALRRRILAMGDAMAKASDGRLRVARNEAAALEDPDPEAATFLKLDGARTGRDLEVYGFMGEDLMGWEATLPELAEEIVLPLREELPDSYAAGVEALRGMGAMVYGPAMQAEWEAILDMPAPGRTP